ncbi:hypothetical protein SPSYN_02984 [Sporotomaculum syntrophicum]|uniref:Uncharacterized protein n=1 Tax=Sporotomaculum syntrophicum TaxID=182264 RepID=A0A9D2WMB5_9FIRM|nr:hypothetical protein [Sporotomaculum syntrophicum]KAF1083828.1 hypothetical protein SPSYN_02984 [Sporotomaculum syntrophicum]
MENTNKQGNNAVGIKKRIVPSVAAGDDEILKRSASPKDKARGDYTRVTTLSYDEVES